MEQLDWSLVGKTQVVAVDMLWEHIPTVGLMVLKNKNVVIGRTDGEGVDEIDKHAELLVRWTTKARVSLVALMHQANIYCMSVHVVEDEHEVEINIGSVQVICDQFKQSVTN
ncbi:hypothetical protein Tco_0213463 [Tanacetum coccineum]